MKLLERYGLRLERKRARLRAWRCGPELRARRDRSAAIRPRDILLFAVLRDERVRLPYFLDYYRRLGVDHFLMIDNASTDGGAEWLEAQPDVSLWSTKASYRRARYGVDWLNRLQARHGHGHWCLTVDVDEFLVYPFCDSRPLRALTDWLDASALRSFGAMLLDMYPRGPIDAEPYRAGQDPFEIACWFDAGNYSIHRNPRYGNLWIQGGPRARVFFADTPAHAPALNKIPLVRWDRRYAWVSSTHMLLPRGLNNVHDSWGGEKASGLLLHAKWLSPFVAKAAEELRRGEHYAAGREYRAYARELEKGRTLWCPWSERLVNWRQLELLGLMSSGNWA